MTDKSRRIEELEEHVRALEMRLSIVQMVHSCFLAQSIKHQFPQKADRIAFQETFFGKDQTVSNLYVADVREVIDQIFEQL